MAKGLVLPIPRVHRHSLPTSADVGAIHPLAPKARMPPISDPSVDDETTTAVQPMITLSRRRQPSSGSVKTKIGVPPSRELSSLPEPSSDAAAISILSPSKDMQRAPEPSSDATDLIGHDTLCSLVGVSEPSLAGGEAEKAMSPVPGVPRSPSQTLNAIRELHRQREDLLRAEGDLTRRVKAICRRFAGCTPTDDAKAQIAKERVAAEAYAALNGASVLSHAIGPHAMPLLAARDGIAAAKVEVEKRMTKMAKTLHVAPFVEATRGFGWIGLAQIVGEAGDLSLYANPAKVWKRFGLGLISGGERQRKFADAAKAVEAGYSPRRRSLMFVLGDSLLKQQGPYRELYLARKLYEEQKAPTLTKMAWHRRAQRYMEKRLLRNLWRAWTGTESAPE